jgi:CubicO group peptidase (beta-lactamase class C family)
MDLESFVRKRITGPLKMNDTGFCVKPAAVSRLAKPDGPPNAAFGDATQKPNIFSGGSRSVAVLFANIGEFVP